MSELGRSAVSAALLLFSEVNMKSRTWLFTYGSLRPSEDPPKTMRYPQPDSINGDEIQMAAPHRWAEVELSPKIEKIPGYTMIIDVDELDVLDKREAPEYRRVMVQTDNGHDAWVYEYNPNQINHSRWNILFK